MDNDLSKYASRPGLLRCLLPLVAAVAMCLALACPQQATAAVYDDDIVGTITLGSNQQVAEEAPDVQCGYGALMASDGKVLWRRDADTRVPMASTTKIMNAVVALERGSLADMIEVSAEAASKDGSTAYLSQGDVLSLEEMLYAMMLPSGNDAAYAIAEYYGSGDEAAYVKLMNQKAAELGMAWTHFSSCNGLEDDGNYTTANDYLKLVAYAMSIPEFRQVVSTPEYTYTSASTGATVTVQNTNILLDSYEGINGVKTGFTDAAGYCFIGSAQRGNVELYAVVFDSTSAYDRFYDAEALFDWGFQHYHNVTLLDTQTLVGNAVATDWLDKTVPVTAQHNAEVLLFDYDPDLTQTVELVDRGGTVEQGVNMGSVTWTRGDAEIATVDLVATQTVQSPGIFESMQIGWCRFTTLFTGDDLGVKQSVSLGDSYQLVGAYQTPQEQPQEDAAA